MRIFRVEAWGGREAMAEKRHVSGSSGLFLSCLVWRGGAYKTFYGMFILAEGTRDETCFGLFKGYLLSHNKISETLSPSVIAVAATL